MFDETVNTAKAKILVVDDAKDQRLIMHSILDKLKNVDVVEAASGDEALRLLVDDSFAAILLDITMPEMDGFEVARMASENGITCNIPIIMVTAHGNSPDVIRKTYESGAVDCIAKPIEAMVLLKKVKTYVSLYQLNRHSTQISKQRDMILDSVGQGVIEVDCFGQIEYSNAKARELLGCHTVDIDESNFDRWFSRKGGSDLSNFSELYNSAKSGGSFQVQDMVLCPQNGDQLPVELTCTTVDDTKDPPMILSFQDISERLRMEKRLLHLASYDPLTQLCNRAAFHDNLSRAIARSKRNGSMLALFILDLDHFKQVNDTLGHDIGDVLLKAVAGRLRTTLRESDIAARLGGDEFAVIAEDLAHGVGSCSTLCEKLIAAISEPYDLKYQELGIETSIGFAICEGGNRELNDLVKCADLALYSAKAAGRNTYQLYEPQMSAEMVKQADIKSRLQKALENHELVIHYQPQVSLVEKRVTGLEALLRWFPSDRREPISPGEFMPVAEQSHLIEDINILVLEKVCQQLDVWKDVLEAYDFSVSVNLSKRELEDAFYIDRFIEDVKLYSFSRQRLIFEITESAVAINSGSIVNSLNKLKAAGFGLVLDDFGTGFSSLSCLQEVKIDGVKIDRSFMRDVTKPGQTDTLVKAIIGIAETFKLDLIAEGVESEEQLRRVYQLGCEKVQGYYFSKPVAVDKVQTMLANPLSELFLHQIEVSKALNDKPEDPKQIM